jgi:hypothetical protein
MSSKQPIHTASVNRSVTRAKVADSEREVARARRERLLPVGTMSHEALLRYETTIERSLYRAMHELERLQARRRYNERTREQGVIDVGR